MIRARLAAAALLLVAMVMMACAPGGPTSTVEAECDAQRPCAAGLLCQEGRCVGCARDRDCAPDELCHPFERRCELRACFGRDCRLHDDCALGLFCVQGLCLPPEGDPARGCAVQACEGSEACPDGSVCDRENGVCEEPLGCLGDADCAADERCDAAAGRCAPVCADATAEADCGAGMRCLAGLCVDCVVDADCPTGLQCAADTHRCESPGGCFSDRDCALPLTCHPQTRRCTIAAGPCSSSEACGEDEACDPTTGRCRPAACQPDRLEPNDTVDAAPLLLPGREAELTLCDGELDLYRVALAAGDQLQALLEADATLPIRVSLQDDAGRERASGGLLVTAGAAEAGTWVVAVTGDDPHLRYSLRLAVSRGVPCAADADEPNDLPAQATPIEAGASEARSLCPGEDDWFVLAAIAGRPVRVTLLGGVDAGGAGAGAALQLSLWDGAGLTRLAEADGLDGAVTAEATLTVGTRLLVRVAGRDGASQARYALRVEVSP